MHAYIRIYARGVHESVRTKACMCVFCMVSGAGGGNDLRACSVVVVIVCVYVCLLGFVWVCVCVLCVGVKVCVLCVGGSGGGQDLCVSRYSCVQVFVYYFRVKVFMYIRTFIHAYIYEYSFI